MWLALVIILATSGQVYTANSPAPFKTQKECVVANQKVEDSLLKNTEAGKEVKSYRFECVEVTDKTFKKPGLDM